MNVLTCCDNFRQSFAKLNSSIRNYPSLPKRNQAMLRIWASSTGNFTTAIFKFLSGCMTGSGFLCVSAFYSFLFGLARRQVVISEVGSDESPYRALLRIGIYVLLGGFVYSVYIGRLILYPKTAYWNLPICLLISFYTFLDVGLAAYTLLSVKSKAKMDPLLLGQKLMSLAAALPMIVMTQTVLNSYAAQINTSVFDGCFGIAIGIVILDIGLGMVLFAKKRLKVASPFSGGAIGALTEGFLFDNLMKNPNRKKSVTDDPYSCG